MIIDKLSGAALPTSAGSDNLPFSLDVPTVTRLLALKNDRRTYELLERGKIPGARKLGALWRINRDVLLEWLRGNPVPR